MPRTKSFKQFRSNSTKSINSIARSPATTQPDEASIIMETAYLQQALRSANGIELIIALYDGAVRFLYRAIQCVDESDEIGRRIAVKRAVHIIMYLHPPLRTNVRTKP